MSAKPILIGTCVAAAWAIRFYEKNGYRVLSRPDTVPHLRCAKDGGVVLRLDEVRHLREGALALYRAKYGLLSSAPGIRAASRSCRNTRR
jgi:hypothetical protein